MRFIILIASVAMLSGCSLFKTQDRFIEKPVPSVYSLLPATQATPIETKEVTFNVISRQKFMETLMEKYGLELDTASAISKEVFEDDISLFTVNSKNYGNLSENMQEIIRFIKEQREIIQYYRDNVPEPKKIDSVEKDG